MAGPSSGRSWGWTSVVWRSSAAGLGAVRRTWPRGLWLSLAPHGLDPLPLLRTHPDARGTPIPQAVSASGRRLLKSLGLDRVAEIYDDQPRLAETESLTHTDIQWTTELGNALLAPQSDVMDAGQRMRKKAQGTGALKTTEQRKVETKVVEQPPAATSIALPRPTIGTGW